MRLEATAALALEPAQTSLLMAPYSIVRLRRRDHSPGQPALGAPRYLANDADAFAAAVAAEPAIIEAFRADSPRSSSVIRLAAA